MTYYPSTGESRSAPAIKMKKLTGTTGSSEGSNISIAHELDASKILGVQILIEDYSGRFIPPISILTEREYNYDLTSTLIYIRLAAGNSGDITSSPITMLFTYEE